MLKKQDQADSVPCLAKKKVHSGKHNSTIIYVWRRFETEVLVEFLKSSGVSAGAYHAGMEPHQKQRTQELFNRGSVEVVVATVRTFLACCCLRCFLDVICMLL